LNNTGRGGKGKSKRNGAHGERGRRYERAEGGVRWPAEMTKKKAYKILRVMHLANIKYV